MPEAEGAATIPEDDHRQRAPADQVPRGEQEPQGHDGGGERGERGGPPGGQAAGRDAVPGRSREGGGPGALVIVAVEAVTRPGIQLPQGGLAGAGRPGRGPEIQLLQRGVAGALEDRPRARELLGRGGRSTAMARQQHLAEQGPVGGHRRQAVERVGDLRPAARLRQQQRHARLQGGGRRIRRVARHQAAVFGDGVGPRLGQVGQEGARDRALQPGRAVRAGSQVQVAPARPEAQGDRRCAGRVGGGRTASSGGKGEQEQRTGEEGNGANETGQHDGPHPNPLPQTGRGQTVAGHARGGCHGRRRRCVAAEMLGLEWSAAPGPLAPSAGRGTGRGRRSTRGRGGACSSRRTGGGSPAGTWGRSRRRHRPRGPSGWSCRRRGRACRRGRAPRESRAP